MNVKGMFVVLVTLALIGMSAATGYAGGGGVGGPAGTRFFQCYPVQDGPNPPQSLEVNDQFIIPTVEKVGKLKMICSFDPSVTVVGDEGLNPLGAFDHITCYEVDKARAKAVVTYTDNFFADPQTVKVDGPAKFICVAATKTCDKGCPEDP